METPADNHVRGTIRACHKRGGSVKTMYFQPEGHNWAYVVNPKTPDELQHFLIDVLLNKALYQEWIKTATKTFELEGM